ncbi:MAG: branched-chain amino acid transport system II carrier protein [Flavobacteriaceae bacterium]|nr:branched-chain amino acid transport system II carrier protein [Flavobacteriaceae bacterium]
MNKTKETFLISFALFSLFFGAGNLLLPPLLGYNSGSDWWIVAIGFTLTAVVIPIFGIFAHARLQGNILDFGNKVSPRFSVVYGVLIYVISIAIPSPRTAAATHEIAIYPVFETAPFFTSIVYFSLVLVFVLNRAKLLNLVAKFLTPLLGLILVLIIGIGLLSNEALLTDGRLKIPLVEGLLEGYQTFDAIGAVVVGAVVIISLNFNPTTTYKEKRILIRKSGFIAGLVLFIMYAGLMALGAYYGAQVEVDLDLSSEMQRAIVLRGISTAALGGFGNAVLSVLIALACFTTAVGIIAGAADFFKGLCKNSQTVYTITAIIACVFGVVVGQFNFHYIIIIALPILMFIYPITIVLILLNVLPEQLVSSLVFKWVVLTTFIFSLPDVFSFLISSKKLEALKSVILYSEFHLGWVLPSICVFIVVNTFQKFSKKH